MSEIKIIPDAIPLLMGVGGLIVYASISLLFGFADYTLLAFSLMCIFFGLFIIAMLKINLVPECKDEFLRRRINE